MAKFCSNCGSPLDEGAKFCQNCGSAAENPKIAEPDGAVTTDNAVTDVEKEAPAVETTKKPRKKRAVKSSETQKISEHISLYDDGKYRWRYDMSLIKNPTFFFLVWKIFFFIILAGFTIMFFASLGQKNFFWDGFLENLKAFGIAIGVMTGVAALGYLLYAAIMGWKYCVEFEMNEDGVLHKQVASQAKKAKNIARATMTVGLAAGRFSTVGAGIAASRTEMYSGFDKVRKVKSYPRRGTIKVNERFSHNQVYVFKEDFDFVNEYIISHCKNLKSKK